MMLKLYKYRTIGNDFIIVDNRDGSFDELADDTEFKKTLNRRIFGVGSAGIVEVKSHPTLPFEMFYHVGTGERGLACGTGSRCLVAFARDSGLIEEGKSFNFKSHEGVRTASITGNDVSTSMCSDCKILETYDGNNYFIYTGVYCHVRFVLSGIANYNVIDDGRKVAEMERYKSMFPTPTFMLVEISEEGGIKVRCYDKTTHEAVEVFDCGTGTLASVIAYSKKLGLFGKQEVAVRWRDGVTRVNLCRDDDDNFSDCALRGKAVHLFDVLVDVSKFKMTAVDMSQPQEN